MMRLSLSLGAVASLILFGLCRSAAFSTVPSLRATDRIGISNCVGIPKHEASSLFRFRQAGRILCGATCAISRDTVPTSRREAIPRVAFSIAAASSLLLPNRVAAKDSEAVWTPDTRLALEGGKVQVPVIGFGTYNTKPEQVTKAVAAAMAEGMRGFDCGSAYGNEKEVGQAIKDSGLARRELCLTSKIANAYQTKPREAVLRSIQNLNAEYLDLVLVHSPLTDKSRRVKCWEELQACKAEGLVSSIGTANFGIQPLSEIEAAGLPSPALNQLELSPFNQRREIAEWCKARSIALSSGSWSKLSNKETGAKNWPKLKEVAVAKGILPQQALIAWSLQRRILCNPRSAAENDKDIETIQQNFSGMRGVVLSQQQLATIDALDEALRSGALGRRDGWADQDVTGPEWDPTLI